ncbi:hypothetical protein Nepgr_015192 [Nepenthes gracilis]|uniref:Dolichyl-diphosphooligosaccharide--protein glycosyltransferase subunit 4 n=1 Tax=Nepenthes gracilis TaxID=150966 RepID=A0AAD3XR30_NEPGR|nr:hypothetical protein Nepgr_015192 [Nepenthes gracilis]
MAIHFLKVLGSSFYIHWRWRSVIGGFRLWWCCYVLGASQRTTKAGRRREQDSRFQSDSVSPKMIDDQTLGFLANFVGIFVFVLVIAYHYVVAEPRYDGN